MKVELRLPVGLIDTVLDTGGRLSADLDGIDHQQLREMISRSDAQNTPQRLENGGDQFEITME
jgi:hypothetical protein